MTDSVRVIGAHEGMLLVATSVANFERDFVLDCGGWLSEFSPSSVDPARQLVGVNLLASGSAEELPWQLMSAEAGTKLGVNASPKYSVTGEETPYVVCGEGVDGAVVRYVDPLFGAEVPVTPGADYVAYGRFALHRSKGRLRVTVLDAAARPVMERVANIPPVLGGTRAEDFAEVELAIEVPAGGASVHYELELYARERSDAPSTGGYLFFIHCGLALGTSVPSAWSPRPPEAAALLGLRARGRGKGSLFAAPVDGAARGVTDLVVRRRSGKAEVVARFALPDTSSVIASLGELGGNRIAVEVSGYADPVAVFVDNQHVETLPPADDSGQLRTELILPGVYFDGALHLVEVRDSTGLRILGRTVEFFPSVLTPWAVLQQYAGHPMPTQLSPAAGHRYRSLLRAFEGLAGADEASIRRAAALGDLHHVLEGGFEQLTEFSPLEFPDVEDPLVSVVVPVHDKFSVTYYCLCALLFADNDVSFEVIVVDDGSSDETLDIEKIVSNITVVRHETAQGFVGACNAGAAKARGRFVALLNNDTEPTVGWLDELVGAFERFDDVGMVGSKLLYPDGRLQDAGGIVWRTGNPWNYGRGENPHDPRFAYARQADYLSGAALMLPRSVWEEVGALSKEFAPAYFEDTDLAFKVREAGYTTWYIPSSVVYHFEGLSNGTDVNTTSGLKRFQEINRPKFKRRWAAAVRNNGDEGAKPDLAKDRGVLGRVLFVDYQFPRPDQDAGSYAALQEVRLVQSLGYKVTFIPTNVAYLGKYVEELNRIGVETIYAPFYFSVDEFLGQRGSEFDAVYITRYGVARNVLDSVRVQAPQAKVLFCNADLHFLRQMRAALRTSTQEAWDEAIAVRDEELAVMWRVDAVLSYNDVEHSVILSHSARPLNVVACPWVVDVDGDAVDIGFSRREGIAFLGNYRHPPNSEAVHFFVEEVMPLLEQRLPGVVFHIYGSAMPDDVKALESPTVNPVGYVADVGEVYDTHRVFVAPLLSGAGIKGKVLGAIAHGLPSVVSHVAAEGTGLRHGFDAMIARDLSSWVESIAELYEKDTTWEAVRANALDLVRTQYSFEHGRVLMREAFESVGIFNTTP